MEPTPPPPADTPRDPRTFVRGSGLILQVVGLVLVLGGCLIGSLSGVLQTQQARPAMTAREWFVGSPAQVLTALDILLSTAAGLALLTFGLGMQHERRRAAVGAMIAAGGLAVVWWASTLAALLLAPSALRVAVNALFALAATVLFLLAGAAHREARLHPPPPDEPVTPEFLAEIERQRRHRSGASEDDLLDRE